MGLVVIFLLLKCEVNLEKLYSIHDNEGIVGLFDNFESNNIHTITNAELISAIQQLKHGKSYVVQMVHRQRL